MTHKIQVPDSLIFSCPPSQTVCPNPYLLITLFTSYLWDEFISLEEKLSIFSASILIITSLIQQDSATNILPDLADPKPNTMKVLVDDTSNNFVRIPMRG